MIDEGIAVLEIQRLIGLRGFPRQSQGQEELVKALSRSETPVIAQAIVDSWVASETEAPRPADIYRLVGEENNRGNKRPRCPACGGSGWISRDKLVTYEGTSFRIIKSEKLDHLNLEQTIELRKTLHGPSATPPPGFARQDILSYAAPCACLPGTHKSFTEGR